MATVVITRGVGTKVSRTYGTVRDLKADNALWQFLGADPEASQVLVGGTPVSDEQSLLDGDVIDIRDVAHVKGN